MWLQGRFFAAQTRIGVLMNSARYRHQVRLISGHSDWVRCAVPSDDGKLLASCSNDHVGLQRSVSMFTITDGDPFHLYADCTNMGVPVWGDKV